jgi:hypothetical protein
MEEPACTTTGASKAMLAPPASPAYNAYQSLLEKKKMNTET